MIQTLLPHPATPLPLACTLHAGAHWRGADRLALRYELAGALPSLRLPSWVAEPARREGLWQNSCFELFMGAPGQHAYLEANFSPSGHWAAWVFHDYRASPITIEMTAPQIAMPRRDAEALVLEAELLIDAALLARLVPGAHDASQCAWRLGLTAVLESQEGALSYWAIAHPRTRPDFHDAAGHVYALPMLHEDNRRPA
jgi:hypothetical protein